jgi:phage terminase large subunit-like protein
MSCVISRAISAVRNPYAKDVDIYHDLILLVADVGSPPRLGPLVATKLLPVYVGVDASLKHDSTALVVCAWDRKAQMVRLAYHRVFQPSPEEPLDFERTIEQTLLDLHKRFAIRQILFDPYQMRASAQRLLKRGLKIEEFPQSSPNLTAASQNLYELIEAGSLAVYPSPDIRLAISRAVAIETPRGWRIGKDKQTHKIDVVIALAMAAYAAVSSITTLNRAVVVSRSNSLTTRSKKFERTSSNAKARSSS